MAIKINGTTVIDDSQAITGASLSVVGTVTAGTIDIGSGAVSTTGNVTGGNILTGGIVSATGNITGGNVSGTNITGTLATAAQPNVTSVGTLSSLTVTGNVAAGNVSGTNITGTLATAAQPNITSVGTITSGTWTATDVAVAHGGTGASDAATARTNLGLAIGSDVQAYNATLAAVAGGTYTGDDSITTVGNITTGTWSATDVGVAHGGTGASDAATARTNLGLAIGSDVQAYNATLAAVAGGTYTGDDSIATVGNITTGTWSATDVGVAHGGTGSSTAAGARTNLGLVIGTDVQAYNATLAAVAASNYTGDNAITTVGTITTGTWTATDVGVAHGGTGASDAATARTNLGLGTIATYNAGGSNGAATLDGSGTLTASQIPASLVGSVVYQGTWNASTNTPTLTSGSGTKGYYYVVSVAGSTNLDGTTDWQIGDWAIYSGTAWQKIDNTDSVTSVAGKTGAVTLDKNDVGLSNVENTALSTYAGTTSTTTVGTITTGTWSATDVAVAHGGTGASDAATALTNLGAYPASNPNGYVSSSGVTSVTGTAPVVSSGGATPAISMAAATATVNGYMTSTYASKLDGIAAGATNVTNNNQLTNGAGYITSSGSISGNAATATALQTARAINGVNFNGTAAITVEPYVEDDESTNATRLITFVDNSTAGYKRLNEDSTLNYNPSTGTLAATIFSGTATQARYADLAEKYEADAEYAPGTVVSFGGDKEVTSSTDADTRVAGVVSTNPAYTMNSELAAEHVVTVAFTGRVPCKVTGTVRKGDLMVSAGNGMARAEANPAPGTIIGKALANHDGAEGVIEVVVGRF